MIQNGTSAAHLDAAWRKPSFSQGTSNCAELARVGGQVAMRQNRDHDGPVLVFELAGLEAFMRGVKAGEFDDLLIA